ncbi:hypothetical protein [Alkaliphilus peptidifermentans]|uniref:Uncharacterized protein n=1 Tax=Alkaliphilus peptidifermentans DSM 18978 TaxID=1120976 RepID=A0A1G5CRX0_9FIRM|nr:hypothetical protein [Alkaliphilus peptidifermentans]SCY05309.1 hypothetical protein SAMN03080606_00752 [Alkaliphilus peptidifermentans DSM 18978]
MSKVVDLKDYKELKQREFFINCYHFLNRNLNSKLDDLLLNTNQYFVNLLIRNDYDSGYVSYFQVPIITFIVTVFIRNSDLVDHFPEILQIDNDLNKTLFRNTLVKILETMNDECDYKKVDLQLKDELEITLDYIFENIMELVPYKIVFV